MKKTLFILAALALGCSMQAQAKGSYEAGKAKSTSCAGCHGPMGVSATPSFPTLAGQHRDYLYHSLKDYKSGKRTNPIMAGQVQTLTETDMLDLATFFSQQTGLTLKY
ncbi:MAG: c-type cytochrome [Gammaproteobacteria bacterium]